STVFFYDDTATTGIYTLSLHDALPIFANVFLGRRVQGKQGIADLDLRPALDVKHRQRAGQRRGNVDKLPLDVALQSRLRGGARIDRKSTRLNSSHVEISYAVFCLKKKT